MSRKLLEEHQAMVEVYESRIVRAKIVRNRFDAEMDGLRAELAYVEKRIGSLQKEYRTAPQIVEEYTAKLASGRKTVEDLLLGQGVTQDKSNTRSSRKPKTRVEKAKEMSAKLTQMLHDDPSLVDVLNEALQENT